jgi:hypothetical protein
MARRTAAIGQLRTASRVEMGLAGALIVVAALMSATQQPVPQLAAESRQAALDNVRTTHARAVSGQFAARVRAAHTGVGDGTATVFEISVRSHGAPVPVRRARGVLTGGGIHREVPLQSEEPGTWSSRLLPLLPGRYRLRLRLDPRDRASLTIPVGVRVPAPPPAVIRSTHSDTRAGAQERGRRALVFLVLALGALAGAAGLRLVLGRPRREGEGGSVSPPQRPAVRSGGGP